MFLQSRTLWVSLAALLALSACAPAAAVRPTPTSSPETPVEVSSIPLNPAGQCENRFVARDLPFATGVRIREIRTYTSNGAGLAAADFNADGLLDLALASVDNEAAVLLNTGGLKFRSSTLADSFGRGVSAVDVDADGRVDLAFTHRGLDGVSFWHNQGPDAAGKVNFIQQALPGVDYTAYAMAWGDLNGDQVLDLVTGSYNTDLSQHTSDPAILKDRTGIVVYTQEQGKFQPQRLDQEAETLSIGLLDLDSDGRTDIWSANDFLVHDKIWLASTSGWTSAAPFKQTSYSTMSIEWGDLANSGGLELYTTDMNPYDISIPTMASWVPVLDKLEQRHDPDDPQIMQNMLQARDSRGNWRNQAPARGVDATGWSWAARFGDLDNDGFLDLYAVNGMIADNLFSYLPNSELVEENQAFRNKGTGVFTRAPEWGLNGKKSGRGMIMADFDNDGDLDVAVNNLRASAQLFENRLCGGESLEVDLSWAGSGNTRAIGAWLELHTSAGVLRRDVRASGGYLSTDPARVHFGFPKDTSLDKLVIHWPDGTMSTLANPQAHSLLEVKR